MRDCDVHVPVSEYIIVKWMSYTVVTPGVDISDLIASYSSRNS